MSCVYACPLYHRIFTVLFVALFTCFSWVSYNLQFSPTLMHMLCLIFILFFIFVKINGMLVKLDLNCSSHTNNGCRYLCVHWDFTENTAASKWKLHGLCFVVKLQWLMSVSYIRYHRCSFMQVPTINWFVLCILFQLLNGICKPDLFGVLGTPNSTISSVPVTQTLHVSFVHDEIWPGIFVAVYIEVLILLHKCYNKWCHIHYTNSNRGNQNDI